MHCVPGSRAHGLLSVKCVKVSEFSSGPVSVSKEEAFLFFSLIESVFNCVEVSCYSQRCFVCLYICLFFHSYHTLRLLFSQDNWALPIEFCSHLEWLSLYLNYRGDCGIPPVSVQHSSRMYCEGKAVKRYKPKSHSQQRGGFTVLSMNSCFLTIQ